MKEENNQLKEKVKKISTENKELSKQLDDTEQYSRRDNVIIHGIPKSDNE